MVKDYYKYWGKYDGEKQRFHLLPYHSLDVAAVGGCLIEETELGKDIAAQLGMKRDEFQSLFCFILSVHDLGKFSSGFQNLVSGFRYEDEHNASGLKYDAIKYRHDKLGAMVWFALFVREKLGFLNNGESVPLEDYIEGVTQLFEASFFHHGRPADVMIRESKKGRKLNFRFSRGNQEAIRSYVSDVTTLFQPDLASLLSRMDDLLERKSIEKISWYLAGIAVISDWIGSHKDLFPYSSDFESLQDLNVYWEQTRKRAQAAIKTTQLFKQFQAAPFQGVERVFGFSPSPLQRWAEEVDMQDESQLFIVEDVTGAGKTEAALTLVHRMLEDKKANGFYFALPTTATSNAMHARVVAHYARMYEKRPEGNLPSIVLAHSAKNMNDLDASIKVPLGQGLSYVHGEHSANAMCNEWFADSQKKALLAPVGVGTIDQLLQAILPLKHNTLRLVGTYGKVLVIDEVHTADTYMTELLAKLLEIHAWQGGSVILLTATMSLTLRNKLLASWQKGLGRDGESMSATQNLSFPLATQLSDNNFVESQIDTRKKLARTVQLQFRHDFATCFQVVQDAVQSGKSVAWVRNTVKDATEAYSFLKQGLQGNFKIVLFHARFTLKDRMAAESEVIGRLGKGAPSGTRKGFVVVSTQVFQESLDADVDMMISDICAIDDLIQRAGRLQRHSRNQKGEVIAGDDERGTPCLTLHGPIFQEDPQEDWLKENFWGTQNVYEDPTILWRTQRILQAKGHWVMPGDARELIEGVYGKDAPPVPEGFERDAYASESTQKVDESSARAKLLKFEKGYGKSVTDFDLGASTRLAKYATEQVLLVRRNSAGKLVPYYDEEKFPVAFSTIKLPQNQLEKGNSQGKGGLKVLEGGEIREFIREYKKARYLVIWEPKADPNWGYSPAQGIYKRGEEYEGVR